MRRDASTLDIASSHESMPTIEIDLGSIPQPVRFQSMLCDVLATVKDPTQVVTLRTLFRPSINFHESTDSAFVVALGGKGVLGHLHDALGRIPGLRMRYSDYVKASEAAPTAHLQDGIIWIPSDALTWDSAREVASGATDHTSADLAEIEGGDLRYDGVIDIEDAVDVDEAVNEDDDAVFGKPLGPVDPTPRTRTATPLRVRAARSDATIGALAHSIERMLDLPEGSVILCGPDRRALRRDASVATLRRRWE